MFSMTYTNKTDLQTKISAEIEAFISSAPHIVPTQRGQQLFNITRLLTSALGCADEKVSVASSAADISDKHKLRLDSDYTKLESGEISELIRFGPADHPAFVHGSTMGMSRSESRRLAIAQAKRNDEELQDWRKEQIGRRGQLVASEEQKARGAARKKAALLAVAGQGQGGIMGNGMGSGGGGGNGVGMGLGGSIGGGGGGGISGKGTPPRGGTPLGEMKKSHHKKKPPRGDDENPGQKRKHPNQYTYSYECVWLTFCRYANANRNATPGDPTGDMDDDGIGDTSNEVQDELRYCYCNGPSYGEMVACDRKKCEREWYVYSLT